MNTHNLNRSLQSCAKFAVFVFCLFAISGFGQAPPNPIPAAETIPAGSLIIPMDNINQGDAGGTTFNLRAYGLANELLQANIPVKWAIKPGKVKDAVDFSANVTRIAGTAGVSGPGDVTFSGGPFIVAAEFDTDAVRTLINNFNNAGVDVVVYETNGDALVDIRYTLTHKPKIAIGPDGGNFGSGVHQALFDSAGIGSLYYTSVTDDIIDPTACYTLATQAHSTSSSFVGLYRQFVSSGGNLLLQCASVGTFENDGNGHFQTTPQGYSLFGTNAPSNAVDTTLLYPQGSMPFNQFLGALANQDGAVTEFAYAPGGGAANGNQISVQNSGADLDKFVAAVSQLNGNIAGGTVFELGGHDYIRNNTNATLISRLNGQRMVLNAVFVPVTRPAPCGQVQSGVFGYKSVRRTIPDGVGGPIKPGNTVQWTIDYVNLSPANISNFQVKDIQQANLTVVLGSVMVTHRSTGAIADANPGYTGVGIGSTSDLLLPNAFLPTNGRIQITVDMVVNMNTPNGSILRNQTIASGPNLTPSVSLNSDNIDRTNTSISGGVPQPTPGSWPQTQVTNSNDPTTFPVANPTAANASIEGSVISNTGRGLKGVSVTLYNASTGEFRSAMTNAFGYYRFDDAEVGSYYVLSLGRNKRYRFDVNSYSFSLTDNMTATTFVGTLY
jgi:uncharacterized repeat protein (TIGR01451 family)